MIPSRFSFRSTSLMAEAAVTAAAAQEGGATAAEAAMT